MRGEKMTAQLKTDANVETTANGAPVVAITMGDPAGIGPELILGSWRDIFDKTLARPLPTILPVVYGDPATIEKAKAFRPCSARVVEIASDFDRANPALGRPDVIPVVSCCDSSVSTVKLAEISAAGGDAAFRCVNRAIDAALSKQVEAIATGPLHKEALNLAGHHFPGHTEILASRCGTSAFGMALYLGGDSVASPGGLCIVHTTLHISMRKALDEVTTPNVLEKIRLVRRFMKTVLNGREPRIGVCALNCHAGDGGLFGDEEITIISPATRLAQAEGVDARGPFPADTLFLDAKNGLYDGIVAIYHDQGHIATKTIDMFGAVNVALGLPIIRTSVAHGVAFNLAGKGVATTRSMIEALRVAALFAIKHETP